MSKVFSEYEVRELGIKVATEESGEVIECIGSMDEEMDVKKVTKKCRGVVRKTKIRGTGTGKIKISLHIPTEVYNKIHGMVLDTLIDGVKAYGENSVHPDIVVTAHVFDEDDNEKFKAYPKAIVETGVKRNITNGEEEVTEVELEIAVMPDEYGNGLYEAENTDLKDTTARANWMAAFDPAMVQKSTASA